MGRVNGTDDVADGDGREVGDFVWPPDRIAERRRPFFDVGFTSLIVDLPSPYDTETLERLPEVRDLLAGA